MKTLFITRYKESWCILWLFDHGCNILKFCHWSFLCTFTVLTYSSTFSWLVDVNMAYYNFLTNGDRFVIPVWCQVSADKWGDVGLESAVVLCPVLYPRSILSSQATHVNSRGNLMIMKVAEFESSKSFVSRTPGHPFLSKLIRFLIFWIYSLVFKINLACSADLTQHIILNNCWLRKFWELFS